MPAIIVAVMLCLSLLPAIPVAGQAAQAQKAASEPYKPPRLPDGHPDLQGMYDLATLTPLQRPAGANAVLTREEAAKLEENVARRNARASLPTQGERQAPPKGGDGSTGAAGGVGGYNNFWLDAGSEYTIVNGQIRTSIIVDPPDGRIPPIDCRSASAQCGTHPEDHIRCDRKS